MEFSSSSSFCNCAATEMAYAVEGHANLVFVVAGVTMFGALGPRCGPLQRFRVDARRRVVRALIPEAT